MLGLRQRAGQSERLGPSRSTAGGGEYHDHAGEWWSALAQRAESGLRLRFRQEDGVLLASRTPYLRSGNLPFRRAQRSRPTFYICGGNWGENIEMEAGYIELEGRYVVWEGGYSEIQPTDIENHVRNIARLISDNENLLSDNAHLQGNIAQLVCNKEISVGYIDWDDSYIVPDDINISPDGRYIAPDAGYISSDGRNISPDVVRISSDDGNSKNYGRYKPREAGDNASSPWDFLVGPAFAPYRGRLTVGTDRWAVRELRRAQLCWPAERPTELRGLASARAGYASRDW